MKLIPYAVAIALLPFVLMVLGYFLLEDWIFMKWGAK